ncbi:MAG: hypothetical protein ACXVPU_04520 [Bacteroidia bacterium]
MTKKIIFLALFTSGLIFSAEAGNEPLSTNKNVQLEKNLFSKPKHSSDKVFGIGAQFSMLKLLGSGMPSLKGFGINALFSPKGNKNAFFADFNYYLHGTQNSSDYATAYSSTTDPQQVDITVATKISGVGFRVGFRRYMIKDISEDGFKLYFHACAGILAFKGSSTSSGYDPALYSTAFEPTSTALGFTIGGGFGAEYSIQSKVNIFLEGDLNIPANNVNGQDVEVEIPISLQAVVGVRFHF